VLSEVAGPDEVLVIDRLEVDLGRLDPEALDLPALAATTRAALDRAARAATLRAAPPEARPPTEDGTPAPPFRLSRTAAAVPVLLHYLVRGVLPPDAPFATLAETLAALPGAAALASPLRRQLERAVTTPARRPILTRLLAVLPQGTATGILDAAFPDLAPVLPGPLPGAAPHPAPEGAAEAVLTRLADRLAVPDPPHADRATETQDAAERETSAGLPAPNAGLVLLHPFLRPLFESLGLMQGRAFRSPAAQVRAARLLHAIATGEVAAEEPALVVPRLLCAVPDDLPLLADGPLSDADLAEGRGVLQAVLAKWQGIGRLSPEGLRETFLARPGVLTSLPDRPTLTVERSGVDILLDRLPWSLSLIALSWLPRPIRVDWT
jgi:hypothetical protein